MAAPHVSGVIAAILAKAPSLTFEEIRQLLQDTADEIITDHYIGKRINFARAIKTVCHCIAFTAKLNTHVSHGEDLMLEFRDTILNEGLVWNSKEFRVTVSGLYHFDLNFVKDSYYHGGTQDDVSVYIKHNNVSHGSAWSGEGGGRRGTGAYSTTLRLTKGDIISTFVHSDGGHQRHIAQLTFTGVLIKAC